MLTHHSSRITSYVSRFTFYLLTCTLLVVVSGSALRWEERSSFAQEPGWQPLSQEWAIAAGPVDESAPAVAYNSRDDEYLVVWQAGREGVGAEPDIYARRLSGFGVPLGDLIAISTASGPQVTPAVAYNPNANEYLVVWSDLRNGHSSRQDIYGRRVAGDGTLAGPALQITRRDRNEQYPRVAYNPLEDLFVVVWEDTGAMDTGVLAQRARGDGTLRGQPYVVADEIWKDQVPDIAYAPATNRFLVVWQYWRRQPLPTDYAIYARFLTGSGEVDTTSPVITIAFYEHSEQKAPAVAASLARDEQFIIWQDSRVSAYSLGIYGGRLSSGQLQGELVLASDPSGQAPALAYGAGVDAYLAAWQARLADDHHILARAVNGATGKQDGVIQVTDAPGGQERPAIACGQGADAFLVVWQDRRDMTTNGLDIYGRLVGKVTPVPSPTATPTATATDTPMPTATSTITSTPTPSTTPTPTATETPAPTETTTLTATPTPTTSPTHTPTPEPTATPSATSTPTVVPSSTATPTMTPSPTPTPTPRPHRRYLPVLIKQAPITPSLALPLEGEGWGGAAPSPSRARVGVGLRPPLPGPGLGWDCALPLQGEGWGGGNGHLRGSHASHSSV